MLIKIGELVKATTDIRILKWIGSMDKSVLLAANTSASFYLLKDDICTVVDFVQNENLGQVVKNPTGFYILLYNEEMWFSLWSPEKFHKNVRIISFQ